MTIRTKSLTWVNEDWDHHNLDEGEIAMEDCTIQAIGVEDPQPDIDRQQYSAPTVVPVIVNHQVTFNAKGERALDEIVLAINNISNSLVDNEDINDTRARNFNSVTMSPTGEMSHTPLNTGLYTQNVGPNESEDRNFEVGPPDAKFGDSFSKCRKINRSTFISVHASHTPRRLNRDFESHPNANLLISSQPNPRLKSTRPIDLNISVSNLVSSSTSINNDNSFVTP